MNAKKMLFCNRMRVCKGVTSFKRGIELSPKLSVSRKKPTNHKLPNCANFMHIYVDKSSKERTRRVHKLIEKGQRAARNLIAVSLELAHAGYKPVSSSRSRKKHGGRGVLVLR
jgi:hypothetical protein